MNIEEANLLAHFLTPDVPDEVPDLMPGEGVFETPQKDQGTDELDVIKDYQFRAGLTDYTGYDG